MRDFSILCWLILQLANVEGWNCISTPTPAYSTVNTNAVLQFDISANIDPSNTITFNIGFHDGTSLASLRYKSNGEIIKQVLSGYVVTATAAGNVNFTVINVGEDNKGVYTISGGGTAFRCSCLYILGIPTKPTISVTNNPSVGGSATFTCSSTSTTTPSNHSLSFRYNWKVDNADNPIDSRYSYSTNRRTLTLSDLIKNDVNKQFTCTATEYVTDGYTSTRSDSVTLDIQYGPENVAFNPSTTIYEKEENTNFDAVTCTASCNPPCTFKWNKVGQTVAISNNAVLNLEVLSSSEAGVYKCTAIRSSGATGTKDLTVNVIYGPKNMIFSPATTSYRYNEDYDPPAVTCSSDCYLCEYSWTGPNSYSNSGQVLNLGSLKRSMDGQYRCTATNTKVSPQKQMSKEVTIEVRYGPDSVSVAPTRLNYTVDEGSTLANIKCAAACFPACTYRWTKHDQSGAVSNTDTLPLGTIQKHFTGKYTCTATNGETSRSLQTHVYINVRYGPYIQSTVLTPSTQEYIRNEDGNIVPDIKCSADCYPSCTYTWTKERQGETTTVSTSDLLSLGSLKRHDAANYSCIATNPWKSQSPTTMKQVAVRVRYGPDRAQISVESPYTITEGDQPANITCSSHCYPGCSYTWTNRTSHLEISSDAVLSLDMANRYMTGTYACESSNAATEYSKSSESTVSISVRYAPDVSIKLSTTNMTEGANLTLFCDGSGIPDTYNYTGLTQTFNSILIPNSNTALSSTPRYSSIHFASLHWQDTGTYTCTLNNGIKNVSGKLHQTGSMDLAVKAAPKVLVNEVRFTGATGGNAQVQVPVYSFPEVGSVIITRYDGKTISTDDKYTISKYEDIIQTNFYNKPVTLKGNITNFTITNLEENDFGNYTLTLKNEIGTTSVKVYVIAEGPPSPPKSFYFLSEYTIPTFVWERNFNGGPDQSFVIQTSIAGTKHWINHTNIHEKDLEHKINNTFYMADIKLQPGVYTAQIFAHNTKGHSDLVELGYDFEIVGEKGTTSMPLGPVIGGSVSAVVVIAVVGVILLFIMRRRRSKDGSTAKLKASSSHGDDDDDEEDEVNTVNPMYVSADEVQPADNTYSQPVKKKKVVELGDMYAMVDKKSKNGLKDGDIYENAPETKKNKSKKSTGSKGKAYGENPYENPETNVTNKPKKKVNKDGLIYADLTFNDQTKGQKKLVIHGLDSMTEYVEVDFTKKADPLPDSDDENSGNKK